MKKLLISTCILCAVISLSSCGKDAATTSVSPTVAPINVSVTSAKNQNITSGISYTGEVKPADEVSVSAKVSAKAQSVSVDIGSFVNAGDTLITLDDTDLRLQYNQALASYNSAVAGYERTIGGTAKQSETQVNQALVSAQLAYDAAVSEYNRQKELYENNSTIILAENTYNNAVASYNRTLDLYNNNTNLIAAKNALTDAINSYDRTKALFDIGAASQVEVDRLKTAIENAEANVKNLESSSRAGLDAAKSAMLSAEEDLRTKKVTAKVAYESAETALKKAQEALKNAQENKDLTLNVLNPESITSAKSQVQTAKAALDIAQNNLNNARVTAPISGYVTAVTASKGEMIQPGAVIIKIVNMKTVDVEIQVTESVISTISQGQTAKVAVSSAGINEVIGHVAAVSPSKNDATGLFTVKINVPNDNGILKGGMFANVTIITSELTDVLSVPADAIITNGEVNYLYINNNGTAEKREVVVGKSDGVNTEIISGVSTDEIIILTGKEFITDEKNQVSVIQSN